jgi:hypothetical protein
MTAHSWCPLAQRPHARPLMPTCTAPSRDACSFSPLPHKLCKTPEQQSLWGLGMLLYDRSLIVVPCASRTAAGTLANDESSMYSESISARGALLRAPCACSSPRRSCCRQKCQAQRAQTLEAKALLLALMALHYVAYERSCHLEYCKADLPLRLPPQPPPWLPSATARGGGDGGGCLVQRPPAAPTGQLQLPPGYAARPGLA